MYMTKELILKSIWTYHRDHLFMDESQHEMLSIFTKVKVTKQNVSKVSYLTNIFAKVGFRDKHFTNKIVERPIKKKITTTHSKVKPKA